MRITYTPTAAALVVLFAGPLSANEFATGFDRAFDQRAEPQAGQSELAPYLQCVPFARAASGIAIYGDALTWWDQAEGRYERGDRPRVGAVMAFAPHRNMELGHVATVAQVIDSRTILLDHANWSPIDGRRGQVERGARAVDVSPDNDWSAVRVWYHPLQGLGRTVWPVRGFIYATKPSAPERRLVAASPRRDTSVRFRQAFAGIAN